VYVHTEQSEFKTNLT